MAGSRGGRRRRTVAAGDALRCAWAGWGVLPSTFAASNDERTAAEALRNAQSTPPTVRSRPARHDRVGRAGASCVSRVATFDPAREMRGNARLWSGCIHTRNAGDDYFLWRCRLRSLRCLCLRIFFRRFLITLPTRAPFSRSGPTSSSNTRRLDRVAASPITLAHRERTPDRHRGCLSAETRRVGNQVDRQTGRGHVPRDGTRSGRDARDGRSVGMAAAKSRKPLGTPPGPEMRTNPLGFRPRRASRCARGETVRARAGDSADVGAAGTTARGRRENRGRSSPATALRCPDRS